MAQKTRIHFPATLYPIIARVNRHQPVFLDGNDCERCLHLLRDYQKRYAYVLMENHPHLLMEVEDVPLLPIVSDRAFKKKLVEIENALVEER